MYTNFFKTDCMGCWYYSYICLHRFPRYGWQNHTVSLTSLCSMVQTIGFSFLMFYKLLVLAGHNSPRSSQMMSMIIVCSWLQYYIKCIHKPYNIITSFHCLHGTNVSLDLNNDDISLPTVKIIYCTKSNDKKPFK